MSDFWHFIEQGFWFSCAILLFVAVWWVVLTEEDNDG